MEKTILQNQIVIMEALLAIIIDEKSIAALKERIAFTKALLSYSA